jgi:hypothetical protein
VDSSSKKLPLLLMNMALVLLAIGGICMAFNYSLANISGEYFSGGSRLGNMRLSIQDKDHELKGILDYGDGTTMEVVPEYSSVQSNNNVLLTFEVPKRLIKRYGPHQITLKGTKGDGTISGTIEDLGGVYPVKFERNSFATVVSNFVQFYESLFKWL